MLLAPRSLTDIEKIDLVLHASTLSFLCLLWHVEGMYGLYAALRIKHMQRRSSVALRARLFRAHTLDDVLA